jgi:MFS transporter, SP family, solute carrier family 2 (myo-inositol transporter), member 13
MTSPSPLPAAQIRYNRFLLLVAGLGGLLYGVDVGIIAGALPYLEASSPLSAGELSFVVAAVLLGGVISTLFAGLLADWLGRKWMMIISGVLFVVSIPMIALANGYGPLIFGRLLQGISGGFIGVVVPLYLAECLDASNRGKGTGIFQWLLTLGIMAAAFIGLYYSHQLEEVAKTGTKEVILAYNDHAWRSIFWVSLPPGLLFVLGSFMVAESPRWLFRRGRTEAARAALLRSRSAEQTALELQEMEATATAEKAKSTARGEAGRESLWHRKYVIPFVLACVILACNQATGINSIIGYNPTILLQAGLSDFWAHGGYVILTVVNFLTTMAGVALVDRKGRKFLLSLGTAGIIVSLLCAGVLFRNVESGRVDCRGAAQAMVTPDQKLMLTDDAATVALLLGKNGASPTPTTLVIIYSYGDFRASTPAIRSDNPAAKPIAITRDDCVPKTKVAAFFSNPFASLDAARSAPLHIDNALITTVPSPANGWLVAVCLFVFMAFYAVGPGVCVWLALSELMPTRIRSNGMSMALLLNIAVSTIIAGVFLPAVGKYGYSTMFFLFAACTVVYFITAAFFLPETKGKTLEEIEAHFEGK